MEVRPTSATLTQVMAARGGRMVQVDDDVQGVANALAEIDPHLRLRWSEPGGYFCIYWLPDGGDEGDGYLVDTCVELDHRIVHEVRELYWRCRQPGYSFSAELDRQDVEAERRADAEHFERHAETYERLAHAMRKDLGYDKGSIVVPRSVSS